MKSCNTCYAKSKNAQVAVEQIPLLAHEDSVDAAMAANVLGIELEEAQCALNCLFRREFEDCLEITEGVYN